MHRQVALAALGAGLAFGVNGKSERNPTCRPGGLALQSAHVLFRHGARTPVGPWLDHSKDLKTAPIDWLSTLIHEEKTEERIPVSVVIEDTGVREQLRWGRDTWRMKGSFPVGELTELGWRQAVALGQRLRERYVQQKLIPDKYSSEYVYTRSSDMNRTKQSAQGVLTGLFGPRSSEPAVVFCRNFNKEILVGLSHVCPMFGDIFNWRLRSQIDPALTKCRQCIEKKLGIPQEKVNFIFLRDVIAAREAHGFPSPAGVTEEVKQASDSASVDIMMLPIQRKYRKHALQVTCGPFIQKLMEDINADRKSSPRLYLYSMHDTLVFPILAAVTFFNKDRKQWPPFSSDVTFEVYANPKKERFVRVTYCDQEILVEGCGSVYCPMERFEKVMEEFSLKEDVYLSKCQSREFKDSVRQDSKQYGQA